MTCARFETKRLPSTFTPAARSEATSFKKGQRINHDAIADYACALRPQNTARHKLQDEFFPIDDDRMSGIMAAGIPSHYGKSLREHVDDLAFALVAPLGSDNDRSLASARSTAEFN